MFPINLMQPLLIVAAVTAGLVGLYWIQDAIGDKREAKVRAEYEAVIDETNEDTGKENAAATKVAERDARIRKKALDAAKPMQGGACPLTAIEAQSLARIK